MKSNGKKKTSLSDRIFVICNTIFMIAFVIITLYPVLNTLAISFNDGTDALRGGIYLWPRKFTLKNYSTVLQKDNLITGAIITERVYSVPGVGNVLTDAINKYDNGVIVGVTLFYAVLTVASLILGDVLMSLVDPRISFSSKDR